MVDQKQQWKLEFKHLNTCTVTSLDWSLNGRLLVGGITLNLYFIQQRKTKLVTEFTQPLPFEPRKCIFSPCSKYIALTGRNQKLVMVFYHRVHGSFDYLLLPHTQEVVNFEWRANWSLNEVNVLLTTSLDKIARLWTESDQGFGFKSFDLSGVIDPSRYIFGRMSSSVSEENSTPYIHWLTGAALSDSLNTQRRSQPYEDSLVPERDSKLRETMAEFPDMVFQMQQDGSMTIWGIQGLGDHPRRITKVMVIMRTDATVMDIDFPFFNNEMMTICLKSKESGIFKFKIRS
jgi:hypothetical protein